MNSWNGLVLLSSVVLKMVIPLFYSPARNTLILKACGQGTAVIWPNSLRVTKQSKRPIILTHLT